MLVAEIEVLLMCASMGSRYAEKEIIQKKTLSFVPTRFLFGVFSIEAAEAAVFVKALYPAPFLVQNTPPFCSAALRA